MARFDGEGIERRPFLTSLAATVGLGVAGSATATDVDEGADAIESLSFYSTAGQVDADHGELDDDEYVVARASGDAYVTIADDGTDPDAVTEYEDARIPLISRDGRVMGIGSAGFASDERGGFHRGNEQFLLNAFDELVDGDAVLWDESHGQHWDLSMHRSFAAYAEDHGYELLGLESFDEDGRIDELRFRSTASQVDADGGALTDDDVVLAWAPEGSTNDPDEGAHDYDDPIPLASRDGSVAGFGTPELVTDADRTAGTTDFVLNVWDDLLGEGVVLWDESHDQFYDLESASEFASAAGAAGYDVAATDDLLNGSDWSETLEFFSTASLLDADGDPLTDDDRVAVWAEETAENVDENGDGLVPYPDDVPIPLVAVDGAVVGVGADFATDESDADANRDVLVSIWRDRAGEEATILYDEGHGQDLALSDYSHLRSRAERAGLTVEATTDLAADLEGADGAMITTPPGEFTGAELDALETFVAEGGAVFLHDQADFDGHETATLNAIADRLDLAFRFNTDQVVDEEHSGWAPFVLHTSNVNDESFPEFFERVPGLDEADGVVVTSPSSFSETELVALESFVADGGAVFLFDQSTFGGHDETGNLNAIADRLDLAFRFNEDEVLDPDGHFDVRTANVNDAYPEYFERRGDPVTLADGDALAITTPESDFDEAELDALESFVADGGAVFLFDQSDFGGHDNTETLNAIADRLDLAFRFNGGQVEDEIHNDGPVHVPLATDFADEPAYFADRPGIGLSFDRTETYVGEVVEVFDADTFDVEFEASEYGYTDTVRAVGLDTPETGGAENTPESWPGIDDESHLDAWGYEATDYAEDLLVVEGSATDVEVGRRVEVAFDPGEPLRGNYGRLLGYVSYDPDDPQGGSFATEYNREAIAEGYARVYSSGFGRHDEFAAIEEAAIEEGAGVWSASDFESLPEVRNDPVERLYVPAARSVRSARGRDGGRLPDDRVPVYAEDTATQDVGDGVASDDVALVGVDERRGVAMVGGIPIHRRYEEDQGFPVDTSDYGNFPFLTNLIDYLADADGDVIVAGGQGQFEADGSISLERAPYYQRFLEGVGTRLRQINDLPRTLPAQPETPRAVIVTAPARPFTTEEVIALRRFRTRGGAVVLLGSANATADGVANLNDLAARLNTDLRINDDVVTDPTNNVAGDPSVLETTAFDESFPLFDRYEPGERDRPGCSPPGRARRRNGGGPNRCD